MALQCGCAGVGANHGYACSLASESSKVRCGRLSGPAARPATGSARGPSIEIGRIIVNTKPRPRVLPAVLAVLVPLLFSGRLLRGFVKGVLPPEGTLGVVVPLPEQAATARESWNSITPHVHTASLSPYLDLTAGAEEWQTLEGCDLTVMDCLGYTIRHKEMLKRFLNIPTVLARTVVARAVRELI